MERILKMSTVYQYQTWIQQHQQIALQLKQETTEDGMLRCMESAKWLALKGLMTIHKGMKFEAHVTYSLSVTDRNT